MFNKNKMKKYLAIATVFAVLLSSVFLKKKYTELETLQQNTKGLLDSATVKLNSCNEEKEAAETRLHCKKELIFFKPTTKTLSTT